MHYTSRFLLCLERATLSISLRICKTIKLIVMTRTIVFMYFLLPVTVHLLRCLCQCHDRPLFRKRFFRTVKLLDLFGKLFLEHEWHIFFECDQKIVCRSLYTPLRHEYILKWIFAFTLICHCLVTIAHTFIYTYIPCMICRNKVISNDALIRKP